MSVLVRWPSGEVEEVRSAKLFLRSSDKPMALNNVVVFIGTASLTVKTETSSTLYPFAVIERLELERRE